MRNIPSVVILLAFLFLARTRANGRIVKHTSYTKDTDVRLVGRLSDELTYKLIDTLFDCALKTSCFHGADLKSVRSHPTVVPRRAYRYLRQPVPEVSAKAMSAFSSISGPLSKSVIGFDVLYRKSLQEPWKEETHKRGIQAFTKALMLALALSANAAVADEQVSRYTVDRTGPIGIVGGLLENGIEGSTTPWRGLA